MIRKGTETLFSPAVWMPDTLEEAWGLKQQFRSDGCYIAGGTLMQANWQKGLDCPLNLISLENIKIMQGWGKELINEESVTRLGALMTLDVGRNHPVLIKEAPFLASTIKNIAAPAIRNKATIGGNIANGFGDTIPAFLVMDACVSLFDGKKVHLKSLSDCIKEELTLTDSIIVSVYLPKKISISKDCYFYKKIGLREAFSPSIVTISGCCLLNENKEVKEIRLAVGGVSTPPQRLVESEKLIKGSTLSNDLLIKAVQAIKEEFTPNSDAIFSANYKKTVAANLIVSEIARLTE